MNPKVRIVFAPQFEPFQPYLSLPYLKELLMKYNINSSYVDCNVDFYNWLFEQKENLLTNDSGRNNYLRSNIKTAVSYIKKNNIIDLIKYRWAINVIEEYLQAISDDNLIIALSNLEIHNKYDTNSIKDFVFSDYNLILKYFQSQKNYIIESDCNFYFFSLAIIEQLPASLLFAKEIKKILPSVKIAFGGPFIARFYHKLKKEQWICDIVDFIEPEEGYLAIANIFDIKQLYKGHVTPDFSEIKTEQYLSPKIVFPYLISYGCKWGKCVFCSHHLSYNSYRCSSFSDVISDFKLINEKYGVNYISLCDEYLTSEQLAELSSLIENENIPIKWSTFVKAEKAFTDVSLMRKMYSNGCRLLFFGFETFNQRLLNLMKKGTNASNYSAILKACREASIATRIDLMFGFPTESEKEAEQTYLTVIENKNLFDTPISSIAIALFELREDTPIFINHAKYNIQVKCAYRGNLDETYDFSPKMESSIKWRENLMSFFKQETDTELLTPYNKTHQLILKDFYDNRRIEEVLILSPKNMYDLSFKISSSVVFTKEYAKHVIKNYANGCDIVLSENIWNILFNFKNKTIPIDDFEQMLLHLNLQKDIIYELINFLFRNDFITLIKN